LCKATKAVYGTAKKGKRKEDIARSSDGGKTKRGGRRGSNVEGRESPLTESKLP